MTAPDSGAFRRVLIVLEASRGDGRALERAARLAARRRAALLGLLVEDSELLRIAELPFTREVGAYSARERPLEPAGLRNRLAGHLDTVRRQLRRIARTQALEWSLEVTGSRLRSAMPGTIHPDDLLILQRPGARGGRAGQEVAEVAELAPCAVLILDAARQATEGPVTVLASPGPPGRRAADMAAVLAADTGTAHLTVLVPPADTGVDRDTALAVARDHDLDAKAYPLPAMDAESLARAADARPGGLLVVARDALPGYYRRALALRPGPGLLLVP